jgi:hypothetical protein
MKKVVEQLNRAYDLIAQICFASKDDKALAEKALILIDQSMADLEDLKAPRWETPEQWKQRTGKKCDDLTPVWSRHVYNDDWSWGLGTYGEANEECKIFEESGYKCDMVIATVAGPPPDGWKPEETT